MPATLWSHINYLIDAKFINCVNITEYDIRKANISILYQKGIITEEQYNYLFCLPKQNREAAVGLMILDNPNIDSIIKKGITEAKKWLFDMNNINDPEVLRISNDSIFLMRGIPLKYTSMGHVEFIPKAKYDTFARIANLTIFFASTMDELDLEVKGLGKDQIPLHENYMLNFIANLFCLINTQPISTVIDYYMSFYNQYINRQLDIGFYRELNSDSCYTIPFNTGSNFTRIGFSYATDPKQIDISYNAGILRELYGIISDLHQRTISR